MSDSNNSHKIETVIVLQGGGSLGAYECGVFKTLYKHKINFDFLVGTSIGAVNAAIIAGSNSDNPSKSLEEFWMELSETISIYPLPEDLRQYLSSMHSTVWGNPNVAIPITGIPNPWYLALVKPYLYDNSPLQNIVSKYVDFKKLNQKNNPRLVVTSVDIQTGKPVIFDNKKIKIDVEHVMSSSGYPFYGIAWTKKDGRYLWDGSLMSNTPLREAIAASPICDKRVYLVSLFPRVHETLPKNMMESWHRARDIIHSDKAEHNVKMSNLISRYLNLLKGMHGMLQSANLDPKTQEKLKVIEPEYEKLVSKRGAIIKELIRIERREKTHFLFEDADFSEMTIKKLIKQGEEDTELILQSRKK